MFHNRWSTRKGWQTGWGEKLKKKDGPGFFFLFFPLLFHILIYFAFKFSIFWTGRGPVPPGGVAEEEEEEEGRRRWNSEKNEDCSSLDPKRTVATRSCYCRILYRDVTGFLTVSSF